MELEIRKKENIEKKLSITNKKKIDDYLEYLIESGIFSRERKEEIKEYLFLYFEHLDNFQIEQMIDELMNNFLNSF